MARHQRDSQGAFVEERDASAKRNYEIGDPEFVLIPLLATDPLPYLIDLDGRLIDAKGNVLDEPEAGRPSKAIRRLQKEARRAEEFSAIQDP